MKEEFVPDEPVMNAFGFLQGMAIWVVKVYVF